MKDYRKMTTGEIVADNIENADVLAHYGIDFCCHGNENLESAARKAGTDPKAVVRDLKLVKPMNTCAIDFKSWPLDLLCDYILKIYHRGIRQKGPKIMELLNKVCRVHGQNHPSLYEVQELFEVSLMDLEHHLMKEEQVLFPYIYALYDAKINHKPMPVFHCGSVANPIEVMKMEHSAEGERYRNIETLTGGYSVPEDACSSYRKLMHDMRDFNRALHEHIHLENNIVFPAAIELENRFATTLAAI